MTRVVVGREGKDIESAAFACPVNAFRKSDNGEMVIDPDICIDCGICQTEAPDGVILEDNEATAEDIEFNAENAKKWRPVQ
jgi:ferredoxin